MSPTDTTHSKRSTSEPPPHDFAALADATFRALLATTDYEVTVANEKGEKTPARRKLSDQARRVALLIWSQTLAIGREGRWVAEKREMANALDMDAGDLNQALSRLREFGLLFEEKKDGGWWLQLTPSRMTLHGRALRASEAFARLDRLEAMPGQGEMFLRSCDERRDAGYQPALAGADLERAAGVAGAQLGISQSRIGNLPTEGGGADWVTPNRELGNSQSPIGNLPIGKEPPYIVARAPASNCSTQYVPNCNTYCSTGAVAHEAVRGPQRRFKEEERNLVLERIEKLDPAEFNALHDGRNVCKAKWIKRVGSVCFRFVQEALGEVEHEARQGRVKSPLGSIFVRARKYAAAAGKKLSMFLAL